MEQEQDNKRRPWLASYPKDVSYDIDLRQLRPLNVVFDSVCQEFSERKAYISMGSSLTYKDLAGLVRDFAAYLQNGVKLKKGDRIAIILPNLMSFPVAVFAALKLGLQIININPLYTPREMQSVLADSGATTVVLLETCAKGLSGILQNTNVSHVIVCGAGDLLGKYKGACVNFLMRHVLKEVKPWVIPGAITFMQALEAGRGMKLETLELEIDDIAFLQYTGGTTGKPKGAMLTHGNIFANVLQAYAMYGPVLTRGKETMLTPLPLYHVFALTVNLMLAFYIGVTNILIADARKVRQMLQVMKKHPEISIMTGVNTLYNAMLNQKDFSTLNFSALRLAVGGGAAIQSGVALRFYKQTGLHILEGYGLTECSPLCCVNPHTVTIFNGTIGLPVPSTWARIVDVDTNEEIWEHDVPGELEFKGPQVMKGYFHNEKENAHVMDDGWLRTGDVAVWVEGGYLKIIDRIKDMILVSGFNVFPSEIEDVVSHNTRVLECAAIGVPSEATGEAIKLFVVKKDPALTREDVITYCREFLTGYKVPRQIEFVEDLPKSAVGKVMRRYLKQNKYRKLAGEPGNDQSSVKDVKDLKDAKDGKDGNARNA